MTVKLSVNLNKIALIRNSRMHNNPDPVEFACMALDAGADGITLHPRPDGRHIRPSDVLAIAKRLKTSYPKAELNIEGNPFGTVYNEPQKRLLDFLDEIRPDQFTAVPDNDTQLTSDHGWSFDANTVGALTQVTSTLQSKGIRVSLFVNPDPSVMVSAALIGAKRVELYTEPYARAFADGKPNEVFEMYRLSAQAAVDQQLAVNAGHDLDLANLEPISDLPGLAEVSIGHALTCDALRYGFTETVTRYLTVLKRYS